MPIRTILHLSDIHLNRTLEKQTYHKDASPELVESALNFSKTLDSPHLVLYTGDHAAHQRYSDQELEATVVENVHMLNKYYPNIVNDTNMISAIIGNADLNPDYHMEITDPSIQVNPEIVKISSAWNSTLTNSTLSKFRRRGYLSYKLLPDLHILSLNTVPYSIKEPQDTADPFDQFKWLEKQLQSISDVSNRVVIVGHIPPVLDSFGGTPQWKPHYIERYQGIVSRFGKIIVGQLYGHVHRSEFRLSLQESQDPIVPLFLVGSISPIFGNNPTFTVWKYDDKQKKLIDFEVYGTNITSQYDWKRLYSASEAYNLTSLSSSSLGKFVKKMKQDDALFGSFYRHIKGDSPNDKKCENAKCRAKYLCTLNWYSTREELQGCISSMQSQISFRDTASPNVSLQSILFSIVLASVIFAVVNFLVWAVVRRYQPKKYNSVEQCHSEEESTEEDAEKGLEKQESSSTLADGDLEEVV